ncbi:unnamed protein product [marine sediment metagenome]|uniref:Uncharacterized protein n=1 Tax=marine sediment metagenome TaxID=412755 RepID=X1AGK6_9ZZZZ
MDCCEDCRFWDRDVQLIGAKRLCRKNPPTTTIKDDKDGINSLWPRTSAGDWCGEFQKKEV